MTNLYIQIVYTIRKFCTLLEKIVHYTILSNRNRSPVGAYFDGTLSCELLCAAGPLVAYLTLCTLCGYSFAVSLAGSSQSNLLC